MEAVAATTAAAAAAAFAFGVGKGPVLVEEVAAAATTGTRVAGAWVTGVLGNECES